jgi:hypothetical protein
MFRRRFLLKWETSMEKERAGSGAEGPRAQISRVAEAGQ